MRYANTIHLQACGWQADSLPGSPREPGVRRVNNLHYRRGSLLRVSHNRREQYQRNCLISCPTHSRKAICGPGSIHCDEASWHLRLARQLACDLSCIVKLGNLVPEYR